MDFKRLDDDVLEMVLATLKDFMATEAPLEKRLEWDKEDVCPEDVVRKMIGPEIGLHLVFVPEEYEGLGGGAWDLYKMCTLFAELDLGMATSMLAIALGTDPIRVGCTDEQKKKWMTKIATDGLVVAYAVTEPEAGSNVENLKTKAEQVTDDAGNVTHYRLRGVKQFISNGAIADLYTVLARAPGGPTFFVVEKGAEGLSSGKQEEKHGIRLSNTSQVILDDVVIPASNIIGEGEGHGIKQSNEVFGYTRLMVAAFGLGCGQVALDRAVAYSKERLQFGTPLSEKQGFTHKLLVPHSVRLAAARAYIEYVSNLLDSGDFDRQVEGSIAKLFATEEGNVAADHAVQALGGYGYCTEYEVEKIRRDARILTIYEGTSEIQQNIIGVFRMRQDFRSKGAFYGEMADSVAGLEHVGGDAVAHTARFLSKCARATFKKKLTKQQHALFELAWAMAECEVAVALCQAAAEKGDDLLAAQARLFSAEVRLSVPARLLKIFAGSGVLDEEEMADFVAEADLNDAVARQAGTLADMDFVARTITA
ncbi:MAG: acyl-CoA dehydrogenase family protein [Planctomycetota bacterium]